MKAKQIEYVPGVGIDLEKFSIENIDGVKKRKELGIPEDCKWLLSVGELIPRKNHECLIRSVANIENVYLTIAGCGVLLEFLQELIEELGLSNRVKLLGFRSDILELCQSCDAFALASFHEGLLVAIMEAMATSCPIVCSRIRGNIDLVDENGGILFDPHSVEECKGAINQLLLSDLKGYGKYNEQKIKSFGIKKVNKRMLKLYIERM